MSIQYYNKYWKDAVDINRRRLDKLTHIFLADRNRRQPMNLLIDINSQNETTPLRSRLRGAREGVIKT